LDVKDIIQGCKITKCNGKQYELFVPASTKIPETTKICEKLTSHFDHIMVSSKDDCKVEDSKTCIRGLEITAIRIKNTGEQEFVDMGMMLDIIAPVRRERRPMLLGSFDIANS
jgi:hypothetical protein